MKTENAALRFAVADTLTDDSKHLECFCCLVDDDNKIVDFDDAISECSGSEGLWVDPTNPKEREILHRLLDNYLDKIAKITV